MNLGRYRLLAQREAGRDGVSYEAEATADRAAAEVRVLTAARQDAKHWKALVRRLRLAALLDHPSTLRVRELALDHDPPYMALETADALCLASRFHECVPLPLAEALSLGQDIAQGLLAAHRLGLAHGTLAPGRISTDAVGRPKIDFTGTDTSEPSPGAPFTELDRSCRAPESAHALASPFPLDVFAFAATLLWLLTGRMATPSLEGVALPDNLDAHLAHQLRRAFAPDPAERPLLRELGERLGVAGSALGVTGAHVAPGTRLKLEQGGAGDLLPPAVTQALAGIPKPMLLTGDGTGDRGVRSQLGRFRILEKLGQGGMGAVYRAEDPADGRTVAIKVLRPDWNTNPDALRRFHKEARLLAEVNNPFVTNLLEVNEDEGVHYLVLEFVAGRSLGSVLAEKQRLDEPTALAIVADVARALAPAHERGIVHRDVKPDNILLVQPAPFAPDAAALAVERTLVSPLSRPRDGASPSDANTAPRVKLSDFGLARHIVESESLNVTQAGAILGTPLYMAPEQASGENVDARTDVYALGATLFRLLTGRPPFEGDNPLFVIAKHCNDPPPPVKMLNPDASEAVCQVVEKCLAKSPDARYADAAALLRDLERLLRGEPTSMLAHPRLPGCDPARVVRYDFVWEMESSPQQLWPYVSNTERLNRAAGLQAVQFSTQVQEERVKRFGQMREAGLMIGWEEHPFEWVEARRMGVLRQFHSGPLKWLISQVELTPRAGGGTTLAHRVRLEPHGLLGRTAAAVKVGVQGRRALDRIYRRIDAALSGKLGPNALVDPFEEPPALSGARRRRLDQLLDRLGTRGLEPVVVERLGDFLALAPAQEVARIRPLALARRLALDPAQVIAACLHGAHEGLLILLWDILCPVCRIPSEVKDTLKALRDHGHCEACNLDFDLDFANSVEMIFRAHPEVRDAEVATFCIGGPAHSPHVAAQVRVASGERIELELALSEGAYRLRGPQLPFHIDFRIEPAAGPTRWDLRLAHGPDPTLPRLLRAGRQLLALTNDHNEELVVRVERTVARDDALTAARAAALALFRDLFPGEVLSPGQLVSVATVTLLVTGLDAAADLYRDQGDARAFAVIHVYFRLLDERIRQEGGALVKTLGEGVVAAFGEPVAAVRTALDLQALLRREEKTRELRLRVGIHRGPAMAATLNGHLDYFGSTANLAVMLPGLVHGGELVLTQEVAGDPQVAALLRNRGLSGELMPADLPGLALGAVQRFGLP
jgi:serine/threonine protein kinase/class 3 adenylate cyclase